jgi:hypothetical protein
MLLEVRSNPEDATIRYWSLFEGRPAGHGIVWQGLNHFGS